MSGIHRRSKSFEKLIASGQIKGLNELLNGKLGQIEKARRQKKRKPKPGSASVLVTFDDGTNAQGQLFRSELIIEPGDLAFWRLSVYADFPPKKAPK